MANKLESLDMSLDDIIKNRNTGERGRGRGRGRAWGRGRGWGQGGSFGRGRGAGMPRQSGALRVNSRPSPYTIAKSFNRAKDMIWRHDLFDDSMIAAGLSGMETGTKLYVSNLDYGVSNEDIKELFSEIGELKRFAVHYDRNGRSSGSAEVVFVRKSDALAAMKRYNNVQLDGKPMKIEVIGTNLGMPVSARVNVVDGANGRGRRTVVMMPEVGWGRGSASLNRGTGRRGRGGFPRGGRGGSTSRGRGRGSRGRGRKPVSTEQSAAELDKELDKYHTESMQT